ncbi:MAG: cupin domain-containing protein [Anaerolineae bacterium]|nr:cupin domain-containing protein [Anaerolineae bacterium]
MRSAESGEQFVFIETAADTDGQRLVLDMICSPGGGAKGAPIHIHPKQQEQFYIQSGVGEFVLDGRTFYAFPGETVVIPAGAAHTWRNPSLTDDLRFRMVAEPAGGLEYIFEHMCALSQKGKLKADGRVPFLAVARVMQQYPDTIYIAGIPFWMQRVTFKLLAVIARLLGYPIQHSYELAVQENAEKRSAFSTTEMRPVRVSHAFPVTKPGQ